MTFDEVQSAGKAGTQVLFNGEPHRVVKYMSPGMIFVQPDGGSPVKVTAEQLAALPAEG